MAEDLVKRASDARGAAYAPYSSFRVGVAVETERGVFTGANVENASYGLAICAERLAIATAVVAGARELRALAVVTDTDPPAAPCGMCVQTLLEFADDLPVTLANLRGDRRVVRLRELAPFGFRPRDLPKP